MLKKSVEDVHRNTAGGVRLVAARYRVGRESCHASVLVGSGAIA
jgi:hypothetical protein